MKILITGSEGYIGQNLFKYLNEKGYEIYGIDKKINSNILDINLNKYIDIDVIIHLAGISGIEECEDKKRSIPNNIVASCKIINFCSVNKKQLIFSSSQAAKNPSSSIYAYQKKNIENLILSILPNQFLIYRLCNVYGGDNYLEMKDSVIAKFIKNKKNNKISIINGDGSQKRDFIHVNEVCRAIELGFNKNYHIPIDIGTGIGTSIIEIANNLNINYQFNENSDKIGIESNIADTKLAEKILGFKSKP